MATPDSNHVSTEGAAEEVKAEEVKREPGQRLKGKCKWFDINKGYGFVTVVDGGPDVFVHQTEIQTGKTRALYEGQEVEFTFSKEGDKLKGKDVTAPGGGKLNAHLSLLDPTFAKRLAKDTTIKTGTCKWFDQKKGYGFIIPTDGTDDLFVHQSEIKSISHRSLTEGQDVEFKVKIEKSEDGKETRKAKEVTAPGGLPLQPPGGTGLIPTPYGYPGYGVATVLPAATTALLPAPTLPRLSPALSQKSAAGWQHPPAAVAAPLPYPAYQVPFDNFGKRKAATDASAYKLPRTATPLTQSYVTPQPQQYATYLFADDHHQHQMQMPYGFGFR